MQTKITLEFEDERGTNVWIYHCEVEGNRTPSFTSGALFDCLENNPAVQIESIESSYTPKNKEKEYLNNV